MDLIVVASSLRVRGNKGELSAVPLSATPERLTAVLVNGTRYEIERVWRHGDRIIFKFQGVDNISDAEKLNGADVCIAPEARAPLPEDEFYQSDLIGFEVVGVNGATIGTVEDWLEYGPTPLLQVKSPTGQEVLIPFAKAICTRIDPVTRRIEVDLPEGLQDLNEIPHPDDLS